MFEKKCFNPFKKQFQQKWRAENMPLRVGRIFVSYILVVHKKAHEPIRGGRTFQQKNKK